VLPRSLGLAVVISALALAPAITGCGGSAVILARSPNGGLLGLDGDQEEAMADARRQMSDACGGAYTIVAQGETVSAVLRGRTITEYRVKYTCGAHPDRAPAK
jgi:hypothetical protein